MKKLSLTPKIPFYKKPWFRIVCSLFIGGSLQETNRIITGKDNSGFLVIGAISAYLIWIFVEYLVGLNQMNNKLKKAQKDEF